MTEAEWLASDDPAPMERFLGPGGSGWAERVRGWLGGRRYRLSERKRRLYLCACVRRAPGVADLPGAARYLAAAERFADGTASRAELDAAYRPNDWPVGAGTRVDLPMLLDMLRVELVGGTLPLLAPLTLTSLAASWAALNQVGDAPTVRRGEDGAAFRRRTADFFRRQEAAFRAARVGQAALLRDVAGDPFRPAALAPEWRTADVLALARTVDESGDYAGVPVLADALEEAGCTDGDVLRHCREATGHVKGCWVVDAVLERE